MNKAKVQIANRSSNNYILSLFLKDKKKAVVKKQNERIFQLIRQRDVVLWVGAGFSMSAGYPSGKGLISNIYSNLTKSEIKKIGGSKLPLDELAEQFIRLRNGSRNELNKILRENFDKVPLKESENHKLVTSIPLFKDIITTNYDRLFETTYSLGSLSTCWKDSQIPYIEDNKVSLYKIHGCISDLDSVVLSKSDYAKFEYNTLLVNAVINLLSKKSVLFIGYGYEDYNIWNILDRIVSKIGNNRKEMFLVAPNMESHKISYLQKDGIIFLKQKGEDFLKELFQNLNDNIIEDNNKGYNSPTILTSFLDNKNLVPSFKSINGKLRLFEVQGKSKSIDAMAKFSLKNSTINDILKKLEETNTDEIKIPANELKEFELRMEGVKIMSKESLDSIIVSNTPKEGNFDIHFPDMDFELKNLKFQLYNKGANKAKIVVHFGKLNFSLFVSFETFPQLKLNIKYDIINAIIDDVSSYLDFCKLLNYFKRGEDFDIYWIEREKYFPKFKLNKKMELEDSIDFFVEYLSLLKKIETQRKIRFKEVKNVTNNDFKTAQKIVFSINKERQKVDIPEGIELSGVFNDEGKNYLRQLQLDNKGANWRITHSQEIVTLHNLEFNLGSKIIEINNSKISNIDDILNEKTDMLNMMAEDSTMWVYYTDEKEEQIT